MNIELLKKKVKRLIEFCEKKDTRYIVTFLNNDYKKLLTDLCFLRTNTESDIDTSSLGEKLKFKGGSGKRAFLFEMEQAIRKASLIEKISGDVMLEILKVYYECLTKFDNEYVPSEKWVEMSGRFYSLEMERLK